MRILLCMVICFYGASLLNAAAPEEKILIAKIHNMLVGEWISDTPKQTIRRLNINLDELIVNETTGEESLKNNYSYKLIYREIDGVSMIIGPSYDDLLEESSPLLIINIQIKKNKEGDLKLYAKDASDGKAVAFKKE